MAKRWMFAETAPDSFVRSAQGAHPACQAHGVFPQLLWNRGIRSADDVSRFFKPSFSDGIHDPFLFRNMRMAVERLLAALTAGESVTVFGDYDADGITGSTVLISTLREIAHRQGVAPRVASYIPHRDKEGYGLQMSSVDALADAGTNIIVTVDCGIACVSEIAHARERGVDVIVVDHHQFGETVPDGILIHPSLPEETYPFKFLAAVGVAWKLASALIHVARERGVGVSDGFEKWLLDLVSIATITDIVPLVGENRVLEHYGLRVINRTQRPGLVALMERAGLRRGSVTARDVGFMIGPRINAAGRMEHASVALELLLAESSMEAGPLADRLETLNRARQQATERMMKQAEAMLEAAAQNVRLHVLWNEAWSPALVGLVAGKIADRTGTPAVAIGKHGAHWIGSGRSFPAYDITAAVKRVGDGLLTRSGGHVQACGFALAEDRHVPVFAERLREDAAERVVEEDLGPVLEVDARLDLSHADERFAEELKMLAPFGCGNPEPVFVAEGLQLLSCGVVGQNGRHLRFTAKAPSGAVRRFIAFHQGARLMDLSGGAPLDVAFHVTENVWNGRTEVQCKVVDFRPVQAASA